MDYLYDNLRAQKLDLTAAVGQAESKPFLAKLFPFSYKTLHT